MTAPDDLPRARIAEIVDDSRSELRRMDAELRLVRDVFEANERLRGVLLSLEGHAPSPLAPPPGRGSQE